MSGRAVARGTLICRLPPLAVRRIGISLSSPTPLSVRPWRSCIAGAPTLQGGQDDILAQMIATATDDREAAVLARKLGPAQYLTEHLHEVPVHVVPCVEGRAENLPTVEQAASPIRWEPRSSPPRAQAVGRGRALESVGLF